MTPFFAQFECAPLICASYGEGSVTLRPLLSRAFVAFSMFSSKKRSLVVVKMSPSWETRWDHPFTVKFGSTHGRCS